MEFSIVTLLASNSSDTQLRMQRFDGFSIRRSTAEQRAIIHSLLTFSQNSSSSSSSNDSVR
jgi:hypothetical protein